MVATVPDVGKIRLLNTILAQPAFYRVGLYKVAPLLSAGLQLGDLVECTFPGYARRTPAWSAPAIAAGGLAQSISAVMTWTRAGVADPQSVFGYFVTYFDGVNPEKLLGAQNLAAPIPMEVDQATAGLVVSITLASLG